MLLRVSYIHSKLIDRPFHLVFYFQVWTINETTETISTLIQKSTIISMEWDKRNSNILYFGNNQSSLKSYDINEKKILQELIINRQYPYVNQICSLPINGK